VIVLKSDAEIDAMRAAGRMSAALLDMIGERVRPGVTTLELNDIAHEYTVSRGGIPAPLNYKGFPKSICTSVNEVVCHGIPNAKQKLKDGDIINIDVTSIVDGFYGDTSRMYFVNAPTPVGKRVSECARECLFRGIGALLEPAAAAKGKTVLREGARVGDIGAAIQAHAERAGFSVVREFVGHGIGRKFHEDPQIPHYGTAGKGPRLTAGMVFTIEPMINEGHWKTKVLRDGWTAITIDGGLSAQWEHTLAIKTTGEIVFLTESELEKSTRPSYF
jgi:methionyl aminopeptidase